MKEKICPITYKPIEHDQKYSLEGLKKLSAKLQALKDFPLTAVEQRIAAAKSAYKISIQGVQPKLSAVLNIKESIFNVVEQNGKYILKMQHESYLHLPENEDLTMRLASVANIQVPLHGMMYCKDGTLTYFIKRFDRIEHKSKVLVEDFSQLTRSTRQTKYNSSMEKVISVLDQYCTFPMIEKIELFRRTLFSFLIGNEDMHLKNFSLITREDKTELTPGYDFLNSTLVMGRDSEEIALPINGKKHNLKKKDFINYYAYEKLELNEEIVENILNKLSFCFPEWERLIKISFLPEDMKKRYWEIIEARRKILGI